MTQRKGPALGSRPLRDTTSAPEPTGYCRQLGRRRAAASRLPVLGCGHADPWRYDPPAAGYAEAAAHLLGSGLLPAPNSEALQQMWHSSGGSRRVAETIASAWGVGA